MINVDLDRLTASYARLERIRRWSILSTTLIAATVGAINMVASALFDGRTALAHAVCWAGMTVLAMLGCLTATDIYGAWKRQNAEIIDLYRQLAATAEMMDTWKPFFNAINEAHRQGYAAVIAPGERLEPPPPAKLH